MARWRVLHGKHREGGVTYGKNTPGGDIVDSKSDLSKMNQPGAVKFERVDDRGQPLKHPTSPGDQPPTTGNFEGSPPAKGAKQTPGNEKEYLAALNKMTVKELQAHAADEEVDLKGETNKDRIVQILKTGVASKAVI